MIQKELEYLIKRKEGLTIEFKEAPILGDKMALAREMVAFANTKGGRILINVTDDGEIGDMKPKKGDEEKVMNIARNLCEPPLRPTFEVEQYKGNDIYIITISKFKELPHAVEKNGKKRYYIRVGSTVREPSAEELKELFSGTPIEKELISSRIQKKSNKKEKSLESLEPYITKGTAKIDEKQIVKEPILKYMRDVFGDDLLRIAKKDNMILEVWRRNNEILGSRPPKIALVGPTYSGKTTIYNTLFGEKVKSISDGRPDVTDIITKNVLPSGLTLYDTPGVGGDEEEYENITRAFLGITQSGSHNEVDIVPICNLVSGRKCPYLEKVRFVKVENCINEPRCEMFDTLHLDDLELKDYDLIIVVFSLADTLTRLTLNLYRDINNNHIRVLLVGNKLDKCTDDLELRTKQEYAYEKLETHFVPISTEHGYEKTIHELVTEIYSLLPEINVVEFNEELESTYKRTKEYLVNNFITRIAARAATIKVDKELDTMSIRELQALFMGLMVKIGVDYSVGGEKLKQEMKLSVTRVYTDIAQERIEKKVIIKKEIVEREIPKVVDEGDFGPEGVLGGAGTGAAIGAIGGPLGILIGVIGGAIVGGLFGKSRRKTVTTYEIIRETVEIPKTMTKVLTGGFKAAISLLSYGNALKETFEEMERKDSEKFDLNFFYQHFSKELESLEKRIDIGTKNLLDSSRNEKEVYEALRSLF